MDLIAGQAQVFFATVPTILGQVKGDKVRLLAATPARRSKLFPEIPTVQESGIRDFAVQTWLRDELESWRRVVRGGGLKLE